MSILDERVEAGLKDNHLPHSDHISTEAIIKWAKRIIIAADERLAEMVESGEADEVVCAGCKVFECDQKGSYQTSNSIMAPRTYMRDKKCRDRLAAQIRAASAIAGKDGKG